MAFRFVKELRQLSAFNSLPSDFRQIVFYSEGAGDWPHLGPVVTCILDYGKYNISYLTSDDNDPGLQLSHSNFKSFNIGLGAARTILFYTINAVKFIMTLPDLNSFYLKRSVNDVLYFYLFHSINSTHTVYRKAAFDAYDTIFCVGPHHVNEIRRTEKLYGLKPKRLIEQGSCKLDTVVQQAENFPAKMTNNNQQGQNINILLAPSWGSGSFIEDKIGEQIIEICLTKGCRVILRLHPMTVRRYPKLVSELKRKFNTSNFVIEDNMNANESWLDSDVMISDWSGAAIEYSFALQKPVIYIDTPQKINNAEWKKMGLCGFEDFIRYEIGQVIPSSEIQRLESAIEAAGRCGWLEREKLITIRDQHIFNVGNSARLAAEEILFGS